MRSVVLTISSRAAISATSAISAIVAIVVVGSDACAPWSTVRTEVRVRDPASAWVLADDGAPLLKPGNDEAHARADAGDDVVFHALRETSGAIAVGWQAPPMTQPLLRETLPANGVVPVDGAHRLVVDNAFVRVPRCSALLALDPTPGDGARTYSVVDRCVHDRAALATVRYTLAFPRATVDIVEHRTPRKAEAFAIGSMSTALGVSAAIGFAVIPSPVRIASDEERDVRLGLIGASVGLAALVDLAIAPTLFAGDVEAIR